MLQQDKRTKVDETTKKNINAENTKKHQKRRKNLEEIAK